MNYYEYINYVCLLVTIINVFIVGCFISIYFDLRRYKYKIRKYIIKFEKIAKLCSESNNSLANKIIEIEEKIHNIQMYINAIRK